MLTSRVATTATRINYRRHFSTDVSFEQTHPNSRERVSRKVIAINWRRLRIRENEKERKEISKRDSYPNFSSMEEKNFSEGIWMELRDQRGTEERKKERNFALVTCPLLFFSESPRPDALLAIEFFRGRRKAQHPLWPSFRKMARVRWHQSLRNPLSLSSFDCEIWESLDSCIARFPTEQSSGTLGGAKLYSRTTIFYHELRFPRAFLENGCKIFWPSCYIYIFESRCT